MYIDAERVTAVDIQADESKNSCPQAVTVEEKEKSPAMSAAERLRQKLERIDMRHMPESRLSVTEMIFGRSDKKREREKRQFESRQKNRKLAAITTAVLPDTKEEILELVIMACSNIDVKSGVEDELTKAWLAKLEQLEKKAELIPGGQPELDRIRKFCADKKAEVEKAKAKAAMQWAALIVLPFAAMLILLNPLVVGLTIASALVIGVASWRLMRKMEL